MKNLDSNQVFEKMLKAIDEIEAAAKKFDWTNEELYANWLAQSFFYVQWTTRQLALASAMTKPMQEDSLHWRFLEEAREEKKHELLALNDLKNLGYKIEQFSELPHTSFFYQTLTYMIQNEHPIAILGYALTLEGFAAKKAAGIFPNVAALYGDKCTSFIKLHCEVDVEHFDNALPHLNACPEHLLPIIAQGVDQCCAIYKGILTDITEHVSAKSRTQVASTVLSC